MNFSQSTPWRSWFGAEQSPLPGGRGSVRNIERHRSEGTNYAGVGASRCLSPCRTRISLTRIPVDVIPALRAISSAE